MPMPDDVFQKYLKMLPQPYGMWVENIPEALILEKKKADIMWDMIPKYYNSNNCMEK